MNMINNSELLVCQLKLLLRLLERVVLCRYDLNQQPGTFDCAKTPGNNSYQEIGISYIVERVI